MRSAAGRGRRLPRAPAGSCPGRSAQTWRRSIWAVTPRSMAAAAVRSSIPVGDGHEACGGNVARLRIAAYGQAGIGDAVADRQLRHAGADRLDDAGALHAEHRRRGPHGIEAGALVDIDEIDADGGVAQANFPGIRCGKYPCRRPEGGSIPPGAVNSMAKVVVATVVVTNVMGASCDRHKPRSAFSAQEFPYKYALYGEFCAE